MNRAGAVELRHAVAHRQAVVLRLWAGSLWSPRALSNIICCHRGLDFSARSEPFLAKVFPVRPFGMALAVAHVLEATTDAHQNRGARAGRVLARFRSEIGMVLYV